MSALKYIMAVAILIGVAAASYFLGRQSREEDYEAACRMSDLIRCYKDHLSDSTLQIKDYGCFEELEETFLLDNGIGDTINLCNYVYCY